MTTPQRTKGALGVRHRCTGPDYVTMTHPFAPARRWTTLTALTGLFLAGGAALAQGDGSDNAPTVLPNAQREFRGVWVATVDNIDWPSRAGLPVERQKAEMNAILDRAVKLKLNAIVFQVRPACDALYDSKLEPWSAYLTGKQGQPPSPYYDPLATWITEAHRRGLELHAWFNPYRAYHPSGKGGLAANHVSKIHPEMVRKYGRHLWLDPGEKAVQDYSLAVIKDVVKRYDVDGIHIDDYFYPYKEKDGAGNTLPFPDDTSWSHHKNEGLTRDDWRRENVNSFIHRAYDAIKEEKRWVKFGISPFGIWRPGYPPSVKGFDQYSELYADARKWIQNGWVDYYTPQLYWRVAAPNQSYPQLLRWWVEQNAKGRNIWPGNFTSRILEGTWGPDEIVEQIRATRHQPGATGNVHFSMKALQQNAGLQAALAEQYAEPALVPASPWLGGDRPKQPTLEAGQDTTGGRYVTWAPPTGQQTWLWVARLRHGGQWTTEIIPGWERSRSRIGGRAMTPGDVVAVSAVDRVGNEGTAAALNLANKG